ncbi:MAG TPA: cytochrome-c peroxidase, partial [Enhygromyxa sp.]|nr:cytochrome-c peroxidase [Enhygromyxa sp.]
NRTATLPQYRFRFYRDDARTEHWTDLPPVPVVDEQGNAALDERGLPIFGPAGFPQLFSTDPGRALITGNPADFEAFDMPQLRGIANTAPYFHDNLMLTLDDVVEVYSRAILPALPVLGFPPIHETEQPSFFGGESLSEEQKADLIEFLEIL